MKKMLSYLWMLPQNLLGALMFNYYKPTRTFELEDGTEVYYTSRISGGITLGKYVYVAATHYRHDVNLSMLRDTVRHNAIGHAKQSRVLGWFYLPAVLLSMVLGRVLCEPKYSFGVEKWADNIANVQRKRK